MEQNIYYLIQACYPQDDFSFIVDSNGMFEKLWQFSSYLIQKRNKSYRSIKIRRYNRHRL